MSHIFLKNKSSTPKVYMINSRFWKTCKNIVIFTKQKVRIFSLWYLSYLKVYDWLEKIDLTLFLSKPLFDFLTPSMKNRIKLAMSQKRYLCTYVFMIKFIVCNNDILHSTTYILLVDLVVIKTSYWKIEETFQKKKEL